MPDELSSALEQLSRILGESGAVRRLEAFRRQLLLVAAVFVVASGAAFVVTPAVLQDMQRAEAGLGQLVMLSPTEGFMVRVKLALAMGAAVALPTVMLLSWRAATRRWPRWRRWRSFLLIPVSLGLFAGGAMFAYRVLVPLSLRFLLGFATGPLEPFISINSFVGFVVMLVLPTGVIFQLPLFVFFLARLGILDYRTLAARRPYALVGSAALGAVLTPPDVFSQILLAIPMVLLYEVSIWVAWLGARRSRVARSEELAAREL